MPKVVKQEGEDPDPTPYLFVSLEQKRIDQTKPYDSKKNCWVPDEKDGYLLGEIKATKGDLVTVGLPGGEVIHSRPYNNISKDFLKETYPLLNKIRPTWNKIYPQLDFGFGKRNIWQGSSLFWFRDP